MNDLLEALKGKKTYLITALVVILGALQGLDVFIMPDWSWPIIGAIGLGTLRAGVNKIAETVKPKEDSDG